MATPIFDHRSGSTQFERESATRAGLSPDVLEAVLYIGPSPTLLRENEPCSVAEKIRGSIGPAVTRCHHADCSVSATDSSNASSSPAPHSKSRASRSKYR